MHQLSLSFKINLLNQPLKSLLICNCPIDFQNYNLSFLINILKDGSNILAILKGGNPVYKKNILTIIENISACCPL